MTTITKERIELFIKNPLENGLTRGEQMELARIALASLGAEPVSQAYKLPERVTNALTLSLQAMEFMGDTLNNLDAVCTEDVEFIAPAFEAVRAVLAGNFRGNEDSSTNNFREVAETSTNSAAISKGWIPVSDRLPESKPGSYEYIVFETLNNRAHHDYWNVPDRGDDAFTPFWNHYGKYVTHWMPLPEPPQEVK